MRARHAWSIVVFFSLACGGEAEPEEARHEPARAEEPAAAEAAPPTPEAPPINLLSSVPSVVAVSSVYRDHQDQIARLTDGSLDSAWNSRTGDLEGAWIAVRLPDNVTVTSIELTAGFTRAGGETDLFTGNHRITRVRVLRDGEGIGVYPLNTESRELQPLPVSGGGGAYRLELVGLLPGVRTDWREVCVSELRVMGRAEGAVEGTHMPQFALDDLPEIGSAPVAVDYHDANALLEQMRSFTTAWVRYDHGLIRGDYTTGDPGITREEQADLREKRRDLFEQVAAIVQSVDAARATRLRQGAIASGVTWSWEARRADLDEVAGAFQAVADANASAPVRCEWASKHALILLERVIALADWERERTEWSVDEVSTLEDDEDGVSPAIIRAEREADAAAIFNDALEDLARDWSSTPAVAARRIRAIRAPVIELARADWAAVGPQVAAAQQHCAWP